MNERGAPSTTFPYGEDLHFKYRLSNRTGTSIRWNQYYGLPVIASFSVFLGQKELGGTLLGRVPEATSGLLQNDGSIDYETSWLSNPGSAWLPPGDYVLWAQCISEFEGHSPPAPQTFPLKIVPRTPGEEQVFSLFYEPWSFIGFCLVDGNLYWASVLRSRRGDYTLTGALLAESQAAADNCLRELVTGKCLRQSIFGPRTLSGSQVTTLLRLMAEFPQIQPEVDEACDACGSVRYHFGNAVHEVPPCTVGPPEYLAHAYDLVWFVYAVAQQR